MGQERSNWTYCQYKGHLTHIKETHKDVLSDNKEIQKDCQMNMNTQHFSSWTNTRQMDKSQLFPIMFYQQDMGQCLLCFRHFVQYAWDT